MHIYSGRRGTYLCCLEQRANTEAVVTCRRLELQRLSADTRDFLGVQPTKSCISFLFFIFSVFFKYSANVINPQCTVYWFFWMISLRRCPVQLDVGSIAEKVESGISWFQYLAIDFSGKPSLSISSNILIYLWSLEDLRVPNNEMYIQYSGP